MAATSQLWLLWLAPLVGALIGGAFWKVLGREPVHPR